MSSDFSPAVGPLGEGEASLGGLLGEEEEPGEVFLGLTVHPGRPFPLSLQPKVFGSPRFSPPRLNRTAWFCFSSQALIKVSGASMVARGWTWVWDATVSGS